MDKYEIQTKAQEMVAITRRVQQAVAESGVREGICTVYCPHTTAAVTVNESTDPDVQRDMLLGLDAAFPDRPEFRHFEGNSAAHLKASVVGPSVCVPVRGGQLDLGYWQAIFFCEFDGPRRRHFTVQVVGR